MLDQGSSCSAFGRQPANVNHRWTVCGREQPQRAGTLVHGGQRRIRRAI